jgi:hypothetical protein
MKIRPVGAEVFRADRRTDITKLIVAFRNFANAPSNVPVNFTLEDLDDNVTDIDGCYDRQQQGAFEIQRLHADSLIYAISPYLVSISLGFKEVYESVHFVYCG